MNEIHRIPSQWLSGAAPVAAAIGLVALSGIAGCASTDAGSGPREEKEYRTGSNLPVRDRSKPSEVKTYNPSSVEDAVRGAPPPPAGLRGG